MDIEDRIKKTRDIKQSSLNTYLSALKTLKKRIEPDEPTILKDTEFLQDYDKVMRAIKGEVKLTSKKNKITAILVALNSDENRNTELIDKFTEQLKTMSEKYMAFLKLQVKTDTQKENWLNYNELIKVVNKVMASVKFKNINTKDTLNKKEFNLLQQLLILRTYLTFPLRNDFSNMKILSIDEYKDMSKITQDAKNYLVISPNNRKDFYINQFKNKKSIGSKILNIPPKLNRVINLWLKHNKSGYYLVKSDMKRPMSPNGITKFLNCIFMKYSNKKISTSMLRHIIISHLLRDRPTIKENDDAVKKTEDTFFHSASMNNLYRKID